MARGKQAALAATRRYEAAIEHIDRLADELVDMKVRARDAEARATAAELRWQRAETDIADAEKLAEFLAEYMEDHRQYRKKRRKEWRDLRKGDLMKLFRDVVPIDAATPSDRLEFIVRRYPDLCRFLGMWGSDDVYRPYTMRHMDEEGVRRVGRAIGTRVTLKWDPERDAADVMNDMLDIDQMQVTKDEAMELLNMPAKAHTFRIPS